MGLMGYFKAEPTEYARISVNGKVRNEGTGISGLFLPHRTSIELLGITTVDNPFSFREISNDGQEVTLSGVVSYKVNDPGKVLANYNFAINPKDKRYLDDDVTTQLPDRILRVVQANSREIVQKTKLEQLLVMGDELSGEVSSKIEGSDKVNDLGVSIDMISFSAIGASPEITKALGASYREGLLKVAARASYERRADAVEQERQIQENELHNKIQLETRRADLVGLEAKNAIAEAEYRSNAAKLEVEVLGDVSADEIRARALYEIGKNAERIETLTITPELLGVLKG